jgi:hypothetical protein
MLIPARILAIVVFVSALGVPACAQTTAGSSPTSSNPPPQANCEDPCGIETPWQHLNGFSLRVTIPDNPDYASWQGQFDEPSDDMQIEVETSRSGTLALGKILLIGGRVMAIQGPVAEKGYEIDALDGAVLELELVTKMLGRVLPDGPVAVQKSRVIDYTDKKTGIQFATPSAEGFVRPPWHVVGELKRTPSDAIEFDLTLDTAGMGGPLEDEAQSHPVTMQFSGRFSKVEHAKLEDQLSLAGWNVFTLGVQSHEKRDSGTTIDYNAAPATPTYKTVADVRKSIAAELYPGEPDSSKDFTGFWKENCEDAWGLQIQHLGKDGRYSVVFCGPGGCGDPEHEGPGTFITKDPHYQVLSEDEIKTRTADGWDTYYRCTRDTHPVLKYKDQ